MMVLRNRRGQVWVETVIYTLIGLALIGIVLALITPRINEFRDRSVIEQTIESFNVLDTKIDEVLAAPGNVRKVTFQMRRGELYFNVTHDNVVFVMDDSRVLFSEPNIPIDIGRIQVLTTEGQKRHTVTLVMNYNQNITFDGADGEAVKFSAARIPYEFAIENRGFQDIGTVQVDVRET